jgi:hypothetical protein
MRGLSPENLGLAKMVPQPSLHQDRPGQVRDDFLNYQIFKILELMHVMHNAQPSES